MKKVVLAIFSLLIVSALFIGCSKKDSAEGSKEKTYSITYGTWAADGEPAYMGMQEFKRIVEEKTGGKITVDLFPSNQLGSQSEQLEQLQLNTIQMVSAGVCGNTEIEHLCIPYLISDIESWKTVLESELGQKWNKALQDEKDIMLMEYLPRGARITSSNVPIYTPEDFKGVKIRVPEVDYYLDTFLAFGANPTPMDFGELYSGLQTGVVEGQENPLETIYAHGLYEVQKYIIETNHIVQPAYVLINQTFFNGLPAEYQDILKEAAAEADVYAKKILDENASKMQAEIEESGVTFITPDLSLFKEATAPVREKYGKQIYGEEDFKTLTDMLK